VKGVGLLLLLDNISQGFVVGQSTLELKPLSPSSAGLRIYVCVCATDSWQLFIGVCMQVRELIGAVVLDCLADDSLHAQGRTGSESCTHA